MSYLLFWRKSDSKHNRVTLRFGKIQFGSRFGEIRARARDRARDRDKDRDRDRG
jgi:hypothetical protein